MSSNRNTAARAMHDLGLAAWFGGTMMGSIGLNGAAADVRDPIESTKVAQAGWGRWTPANLAAITMHLTGGAMLLFGNKSRIGGQKGVLAATATKAALTAGAIGMTAYTRALGEHVMKAGDVPTAGGTAPRHDTPEKVKAELNKLKTLQWTVPALTGSLIVLSAYMGEQQRLSEQVRGMAGRGTGQLGKVLAAGALFGRMAGKGYAKKKKAGLALGAVKHAPKAVAKSEAAKWATKAGSKAGKNTTKAGAKAGKLIAEGKLAKAAAS